MNNLKSRIFNYETVSILVNQSKELSLSNSYDEALNKIDEAITQSLDIIKLDKHNEWALNELVELYKLVNDWNSSKKYLQIFQKIHLF